jgi:adenosylcobinamide-GDP ribazoletransferase
LFFLNADFAFQAIIASEVAAKLAMVTIARIGKPAHKGLGSRFLESAKKKRNIVAYLLAILIVCPLLGFTSFGIILGFGIILVSVLSGAFMERVAKNVFGGVSGDMIGATNEVVRAVTLVFVASVLL